MENTCVRLAPEVCKKLGLEARKLAQEAGEAVTVSDLIRALYRGKVPAGFRQN